MSISSEKLLDKSFARFVRKSHLFKSDRSGMSGVEFAMVVGPFIALVFGIMKVGLIFFTIFALDNAVEQSSRLVRTGQAGAITKAEFKYQICSRVPVYMDCAGDLRVDVQSEVDLANLSPPTGTSGGSNLGDDGDFSYTPGSGGEYVLVTVFFKWTTVPFKSIIKVGNLGDGSFLIRSSATFRNEPFTSAAAN